ncbi:MAG: Holliday junction ATP-dependent DNA helicase RuvA [Gemmatimonadaceae bacterium]|nr:Holliday junction ATP-dependent DNA helicase RuvA [Gemmatimonadaceae bacterium]
MISQLAGRILVKELDRVEILTAGGVAYELAVPLGTFESIPRTDESCTLHTHLVVRDDGWQLYGFATALEQRVFRRLLAATGVGPSLALGMLSTLSADRLIRAIRERDVATLTSVPRVGRKKAEQLILDLADKLDDLVAPDRRQRRSGGVLADDALRALVSLGYSAADAEQAVRAALESGAREDAAALIRAALAAVKR